MGSLGKIDFSPGWYVYVGSAMGGFKGRVNRHLKQVKKLRWHIGYLLTVGTLKEIVAVESKQKIECLISSLLAQRLAIGVNHFGASDCSCKTYLYFSSTENHMRLAIKEMMEGLAGFKGEA